MFYFDKRQAECLHKPKRREAITDILRLAAKQLDRFRHPKVLNLWHQVEESAQTLCFATEPVLGSLANVLGCFEERLPQHSAYNARNYQFLNFEIKYGILQVAA